jgi:hypothetical protein
LEAEGYKVVSRPSRKLLPSFLAKYQPDAIAFKGDKKLAIQMTPSDRGSDAKISALQQLFAEHTDWEFRVIYAPSLTSETTIPVSSKKAIKEHLDRIASGFEAMGGAAALLAGWAAFEAAARSVIPGAFKMPQTPARLLENLAANGYITPDEADALRRLGQLQHEAAHGRLDIRLSEEDLTVLLNAARTIIDPAS